MRRDDIRYRTYVQILEQELVPAMGCTEPIALAYCAAEARALLGCLPEAVIVEASGNIIKNVKSVVVPNTGGRKGIEAAAAAGIVAGDPARELEVIAAVTEEQKKALGSFLERTPVDVVPLYSDHILDMQVTVRGGGREAKVRIAGEHTNIVYEERDGKVILDRMGHEPKAAGGAAGEPDRSLMNVQDIYEFAQTVDIEDIREVLSRQICYNLAIAKEGLSGDWGAHIGSTLLKSQGSDVRTKARAWAAAGSDARMNGCEMPVVINSGSGNQGITASIPVLMYAGELEAGEDRTYRALALSNLITLHLKSGIGRLSAYCGAVSAGVGSGAGIAWLKGGDLAAVSHTIVNALAIASGIVCDGAKSSCAAKIAVAVEAGILGYEMYENGQQFYDGEGLVSKGVENTIRNIGILGREGMKGTDKTIIEIMTGC